MRYTAIADRYQVSKNAVSKIAIRSCGIMRNQRPPMLTTEQASQVVARYVAGERTLAIAGAFGISGDLVLATLRRAGVSARNPSEAHTVLPLNHDALDLVTPDAAYWCGLLFTDGTIVRQAGRSPVVALVLQSGDRDHLLKLRSFLGSGHAITAIAPRQSGLSSKGTGAYRFAVNSRHLADRLTELGRYGPAVNPELAASRDFWRGCVDGDGTIGISKGVPQCKLIGSRWLLRAFANFLGPVGRRPLNVRPARSIYVVSVSGSTAEKVLDRLYADAATSLDRKARSVSAIMAQRESRISAA